MATVNTASSVPLNGYAMQLQAAELESVATGLTQLAAPTASDPRSLAEAVRRLPVNDRAAAWEFAVRRFGGRKELDRAAGEIGMDVVHARDLLNALVHLLAATPAPEPDPKQGPSQTL